MLHKDQPGSQLYCSFFTEPTILKI